MLLRILSRANLNVHGYLKGSGRYVQTMAQLPPVNPHASSHMATSKGSSIPMLRSLRRHSVSIKFEVDQRQRLHLIMRSLSTSHQGTTTEASSSNAPLLQARPKKITSPLRSFTPVIGKSQEKLSQTNQKPCNQEILDAKTWQDIESYLDKQKKPPQPHELLVIFQKFEKMEPAPPHEFLNRVMVLVADVGAKFPLNGLSDLLRVCGRMGYIDMDSMEGLAHELYSGRNFSKLHTRDLTRFIMSLGMVYKTRGGVMSYFPDEQDDTDLVEADDEYAGLLRQERKGEQAQSGADVEKPANTVENQLQSQEVLSQSRYLDSLPDLLLNNPAPISTAEIDTSDLNHSEGKAINMPRKRDSVHYDEDADQENIQQDPGDFLGGKVLRRNYQLELIRVLGSELISQRRHHIITCKEMYEGLYGLCLMKYKRDNVMKKLVQRLRLPEYYQKMTIQELTDLMTGLSGIRFRHHRAMLKISTELIHPSRIVQINSSQSVALIRSMADLEILDEQILTTLALRVLPLRKDLSGSETVSILVSLVKAKIKDATLLNGFAERLLSESEKLQELTGHDFSDLLEVLISADIFRQKIKKQLETFILEALAEQGMVESMEEAYLGQVVRNLGNLKCEDRTVLDVVLREVVKEERLVAYSEDDYVSIMHGIARTGHGKDALFFANFVTQVLKPGRLAKYHIRQMSDLALSFGMSRDILKDRDVEAFWAEALKIERARRYLPGMMVDLLEGARKLRILNMDVYSDLAYRLTQKHRMEFMTLPQFVEVIESLGKLRVRDSIKDQLALKKLFYEFVRPSKAKYLTIDGLPKVMQAILDLRYSERRRVGFLAREVRHTPRHVPLWTDEQLQIIWRGFRSYDCDDQEAVRLIRREMVYRGLPLIRRPPYMD